jgi:hypothetical protein
MKTYSTFVVLLTISATALTVASPANANRDEPVPLYGTYDMFLDRSKQTFNDHLVTTDRPHTQTENFTTHCDASGCIASSINKRPPPKLFQYDWVNGHWESVPGQQRQTFFCNDGSKVDSIKVDVIKANGDGSFSGERTITVSGKGCPGDGPGKYWLPFTLTPSGN